MAAEIEFKFLVPPARADELIAHSLLRDHATGQPETKRLVSTYYDSPDERLRARKLGLRLRLVGTTWVQTIKGDAVGHGGMTIREEVEHEVSEEKLDLSLLEGTPFSDLAGDAALAEALAPCFTTDFERLTLILAFEDGTRVEAALDRGEIQTARSREPICELELELLEGEVATLETYAAVLRQKAALEPGNLSKAKRGYALLARERERG